MAFAFSKVVTAVAAQAHAAAYKVCIFTAGASARGPRLLSIRHRNSVAGGLRNISTINGEGSHTHAIPQEHSFPLPALGRLVAAYLVAVLPFAISISKANGGNTYVTYAFL